MAELKDNIHWLEVKITCNGELAEALTEVLGRFVSNGVVIEQITDFNPKTQENEPTGALAVSGYLALDEALEEKKQKLEESLWHLSQIMPVSPPEYSAIQDENWMAAWKRHYHPIAIGDRFLILPAWQDPPSEETRIPIRINPAMAFGTGTHPTTQLCLQLLARHFHREACVIDVGCGSGILSIAALKCGASHVLAVDVDNQAVLSTLENAGLNDIRPSDLETGKGSVEEILTGRFTCQQAPLVMVNILAPIIIRLFEMGLANIVSDNGKLLLSGILMGQEKGVLIAAEQEGFTQIDRLTDGDWVSLTMQKQ